MTSQDQNTLRQWAQGRTRVNGRVELAADDSPAARELNLFYRQLNQAAQFIPLKTTTDEAWRKPALIIGPHRNIAYQAVPQAMELPIFLEALSDDKSVPLLDEETARLADAITLPAELTLYIAPQCPHCPQAARQMVRMALACALLRLTIVDVELLPEQAQADQIRSVPTLLLEKQMRWTGVPDPKEVLSMCLNRDPAAISPSSLRMLLESGDAGRAAGMMIEHRAIFPALTDLLCDPRWSVRLGAMVTVEYLAEEDPPLAAQLAEPLRRRFDGLDEQAQGDITQVLGQIRTPESIDHLQQIVAGPYAEPVRQAAAEALDDPEEA
jgi:glutaredoxin